MYHQLVHTLNGLLPPPLDHTPEALLARNHAAIAKVAALLPVNANEADLAAQCIASRAQAEDLLLLLRQHRGYTELVLRMSAQYASMVRTSLSVHARLMRVQALRHKREAIEGAANQDAWTLHMAERSMLEVVDPKAGPPVVASPETARPASPETAQAPDVEQPTAEHVSEDGTNSQDTAFETWLSAQFPGRGAGQSVETCLFEAVREAMVQPPSPARESPPNSPENLGSAPYGCHINGETAST